MTTEGALWSRYYQYSKERFPLMGAVAYTASIFVVCYSFALRLLGPLASSPVTIMLGVLVLFLGLMRLRIADEHKDYERDRQVYPERILSKGGVTLSGLRRLFYAALVLEIAISLSYGVMVLAAWCAMLVWFGLMWVEFFVPVFLNNHMRWYLVTHQMLIPFMGFYAITLAAPDLAQVVGQWRGVTVLLLACIFATMNYEISRKIWPKEREHAFADSYTKFWGASVALITNFCFGLISLLLFFVLFQQLDVGSAFYVAPVVLMVVLAVIEVQFFKAPTERHSQRIKAWGGVMLCGGCANAAAAFFSVG